MTLNLDRVETLTRQLTHVTGQDHSRMVNTWLVANSKERDQLLSLLELKVRNLGHDQDSPWLEPIPKDKITGDLELGNVLSHDQEGDAYSIPTDNLLRHATIFGQGGSGKTNLGYLLLQHLLKKDLPFMVFDWKRNYRDLLALEKDQPITVYTVGRNIKPFHINPLIPPPGTDPETWLKKITEIIAKAYYVGEGVMSILHTGIDAVYSSFGVYDGTVDRWPTLDDVRTWIDDYVRHASTKELKPQWIASTHRTLQSMCYGPMGRLLNVEESTPIEQLLQQPVILELDALSEADKTLVIQTLMLWIHHYRLQEHDREKLKHIIVIEEAHHVLRKEVLGAKENILDVVLREIRELGEGIIMIDQSPAQFSQNAVGNSATSFVFALKDKSDVHTAANFLLLDNEQRDYLNLLPVGTCIVKTQDAYRKPFLIRLPHVRIPKGTVRDHDILTRATTANQEMKEYDDVPIELENQVRMLRNAVDHLKSLTDNSSESEMLTGSFRSSQSFPPEPAQRRLKQVISRIDKTVKNLDDVSIQFLRDVLDRPYTGVRNRYDRLRISTKKGNQLKELLERHGVITITPVNKGDAQLKLAELTSFGRQLARHLFPDRHIRKALDGAEHRYWKGRVATSLSGAGMDVTTEKPLNGDRVDVHADNGKRIAVEIETGKSNIRRNIDKNLHAGYDDILILPTNRRARKKVKQALQD